MSNAKPKARPAKASPAKTARKHRASAPRPERHNQWTRQKMRAFLAALAGTASVTDAARAVGMSRQSAHQIRAPLVRSGARRLGEECVRTCSSRVWPLLENYKKEKLNP